MGARYSGQRYGSYSLAEIVDDHSEDGEMWRKEFTVSYGERVRVTASVWVWIALGVLVLSNVLYMVAFCTDGWGILQENDQQGTWFAFGLWQQCSHPYFLCFSPGDSPAFGAARAFAVLGLFGHVFSVGLLLGYMFEKILDFDDCMIITWTSVCFATGTFVFVTVVIFGIRWPIESNLPETTTWLSYSFGMACVAVVLQMFAGAMGVMEITTFVPGGDPEAYLAHIEAERKERRQRSERRGYRSDDPETTGTVTEII